LVIVTARRRWRRGSIAVPIPIVGAGSEINPSAHSTPIISAAAIVIPVAIVAVSPSMFIALVAPTAIKMTVLFCECANRNR
jgi:hypothetical protein